MMSGKSLNSRLSAYKAAFANGELQVTYQALVGIVQNLRTDFAKKYTSEYSIAGLLHGYIDFTYFYLQNDFLKKRKLKFAIVFKHSDVSFELWLLGQTKPVQLKYWEKLRDMEWLNNQIMPEYAILEVPLLSAPDFASFSKLATSIQSQFETLSQEILKTLASYE